MHAHTHTMTGSHIAQHVSYQKSNVVSHDGDSIEAFSVSSFAELWVDEGVKSAYAKADVVAVDEAQFFTGLLPFALRAVERDNKRLVVAGLDGDFSRNSFGDIHWLLPHCDRFVKLAGAKCGVCESSEAIFTLRTTADTDTVLVGGSDKYKPACRVCFMTNCGEAVRASILE